MDITGFRVDGVARFKTGKTVNLRDYHIQDDDLGSIIDGALEDGLGGVGRDKVQMLNVRVFEKYRGYNIFKRFAVLNLETNTLVQEGGEW